MILAYPHVPSTTAGGQLELHVWRSPGQFSIRVFRVVALEPPPTRQNRLLQQPYGLEQVSGFETGALWVGPNGGSNGCTPFVHDQSVARRPRCHERTGPPTVRSCYTLRGLLARATVVTVRADPLFVVHPMKDRWPAGRAGSSHA